MARHRTGGVRAKSGPAFDPDEPVRGYFKTRLVKGGPPVALLIWFGQPLDPETGELMDRAPRWFARINGTAEVVEASRFWPDCARDPISFAEYRHICERSATLDPSDPYFDPRKPVDRSLTPPPF
jgi:hypothetical protein